MTRSRVLRTIRARRRRRRRARQEAKARKRLGYATNPLWRNYAAAVAECSPHYFKRVRDGVFAGPRLRDLLADLRALTTTTETP